MDQNLQQGPAAGEITLVVAQSPRYYPHVARHLRSLKKAYARVRLLYWEKDASEPLYAFPEVEAERVVLPSGGGGVFFLKLMLRFWSALRRMRPDAIEAIDPYALGPARWYSAFAGKPVRMAYFSMEYFTELPSLRAKPLKRLAWKSLEAWGVGGCAAVATVCDSIAERLRADFSKPVSTVRNVPDRADQGNMQDTWVGLHARCGLAGGEPVLLYQGMLQEGRGLEVSIRALPKAPGLHLAIVGGGGLRASLEALAREGGCAARVHFLGEVGYGELVHLTRDALAGLALFEPLAPSYLFSLPGKLFEYIQAGVPVIATALPEMRKIIEGYGVGLCLQDISPEPVAAAMRRMAEDPDWRAGFHAGLEKASQELCWEAEESRYLALYR